MGLKIYIDDEDMRITFPHEVVMATMEMSLIRAWREHLGLAQDEVAGRMGISQPAYQKMEEKGAALRISTLKKIASAFGIDVRQLYLD